MSESKKVDDDEPTSSGVYGDAMANLGVGNAYDAEEAKLRGDDVTITFMLPDGDSITGDVSSCL